MSEHLVCSCFALMYVIKRLVIPRTVLRRAQMGFESLLLASNAVALFPSPRVPSLGKQASADYKRRIVFHASARASTFIYIFLNFLNAI